MGHRLLIILRNNSLKLLPFACVNTWARAGPSGLHKLAKNPIRARLIAGGGGRASWEDAPWKTLSTVAPEVNKPSESERGAGWTVFFLPRAQCVACEVKIKRLYALQETQPHSSQLHIMEGGV